MPGGTVVQAGTASPALADAVRNGLLARCEPARAPAMQAYMKSAMPFLGVTTPPLREACRELFRDLVFPDAAAWRDAVLTLWRGAAYREERYAALELAGSPAAQAFQTMDALPLYEEMIVTGAWWDYVDVIATQRLWMLLEADRPAMTRTLLDWSLRDDMWLRRSAIICQIKAGERTDVELLYACIAPSMASREFFLRKGIGWALRQYARTDPVEVRRFVGSNAAVLSGLTKREALKHIGGIGGLSDR